MSALFLKFDTLKTVFFLVIAFALSARRMAADGSSLAPVLFRVSRGAERGFVGAVASCMVFLVFRSHVISQPFLRSLFAPDLASCRLYYFNYEALVSQLFLLYCSHFSLPFLSWFFLLAAIIF